RPYAPETADAPRNHAARATRPRAAFARPSRPKSARAALATQRPLLGHARPFVARCSPMHRRDATDPPPAERPALLPTSPPSFALPRMAVPALAPAPADARLTCQGC